MRWGFLLPAASGLPGRTLQAIWLLGELRSRVHPHPLLLDLCSSGIPGAALAWRGTVHPACICQGHHACCWTVTPNTILASFSSASVLLVLEPACLGVGFGALPVFQGPWASRTYQRTQFRLRPCSPVFLCFLPRCFFFFPLLFPPFDSVANLLFPSWSGLSFPASPGASGGRLHTGLPCNTGHRGPGMPAPHSGQPL